MYYNIFVIDSDQCNIIKSTLVKTFYSIKGNTMPDYQRPNNENLFHLPLGNIEAILGDANNILVIDSNDIIEQLLSISLEINNINEIKNLL